MGQVERIISVETDGVNADTAEKAFGLLDNDGAYAAIDFLSQWHYPGEHETADTDGFGDDATIERDRYILFYNRGLGHIGLCFRLLDTEPDYTADYLARRESSLW